MTVCLSPSHVHLVYLSSYIYVKDVFTEYETGVLEVLESTFPLMTNYGGKTFAEFLKYSLFGFYNNSVVLSLSVSWKNIVKNL